MTRAKHTPGPWAFVAGVDGDLWVEGPDPAANVICDIVGREGEGTGAEDEANARLIAAAPELLAACQAALSVGEALDRPDENQRIYLGKRVVEQLRAAITGATGRDS